MTTFLLDPLVLKEHAAEVMVYFEKHKIMELVARIVGQIVVFKPNDPQQWIGNNIKRIADEIYSNVLAYHHDPSTEIKYFQISRKYNHRVAIYGRRGSGRKTVAAILAKTFNLVYIDLHLLINQNLRATDNWAQDLQEAFANRFAKDKSSAVGRIIAKRLLQDDALRRGWVLINYPNSLCECQELFECIKIPPNKFLYLRCPELLAKRRLIDCPRLECPQDTVDYIETEERYFNEKEAEVAAYLELRHETVILDASQTIEEVKTNLLAKLERAPYLMGFKKLV